MHAKDIKKPEHVSEADWLRHLHWMALMGKQVSENYAQHLARVTQDADHSKALLQAHYKALHALATTTPGRSPDIKD